MSENMIPLPYHIYILFIIGILIYTFTLSLINGNLFNLYSNNEFPDKEYFEFWKNMTSEQRLFLSETYYKFYLNFKQKIINIAETNKNKKITIDTKFLQSNRLTPHYQYENVPFVLVSLIPKGKTTSKKLLICSHFDGHNLTSGGTAYDDAIQTVSMLGVIDAISKNDELELSTQVDFLFDGAEEFGLVGAFQYVDYLKNNSLSENYDYLNLEAMGGSPPYVFVLKNSEGNYRVQKALSKSRGTILLGMNFVFDQGVISSSTDHVVFNEQNWTGGVSVFLGKGSVYHSKYDKIEKREHLRIAGAQLLDFVKNYEPENDGYNGDSIGYGIAPICIVLPNLVFYIVNSIVFLIGVGLIIFKERKNIKEFLFDLLFEFICFIVVLAIFIIIGLLVYLANSNSASASQAFVILNAFLGLFLFLIFGRIFKIKKWCRLKLIFDLLLMMILIKTDLSLPFLACTILSIIFYFFDNKIIKYISAIFQYLFLSLLFAFILQVLMQYTTRMGEIIGNIIVFVLFFTFSFHISSSSLDLYDVTEEKEKIIDLIKNMFKKNSNNESNSLNDDNQYNIIDELIDECEDEGETKPIKRKNKYLNKKLIPVYLLFFYLLYSLVLLLILLLKPYPYSSSYTVRGVFFNIYKDYQNSTMVFLPYNGYNYAKKYIKQSDFKFVEGNIKDYLKNTEYEGKVFAVNSGEPIRVNNEQCIFEMPEISKIMNITYYKNNSDNLYEFQFKINITKNACIDAVYLYINCDNCVKKVNGIINDYKTEKKMLLIRIGKGDIIDSKLPDFISESNITLTVNEFDYLLLLNTMKNSKDYLKFLESFGEASINTKSGLPSDTIYKYEEKFKP